jgi:tRNA pseudouridine38-40 synthase
MGIERYKAILSYDGSDFSGMQRQTNARSVQAVVEEALKSVDWQGDAILVAGRTDAGVHASGQVIAFDLAWKHSLDELQRALNAVMPTDVAIRDISIAPTDFHPRYHAKARRYRYRILCQPLRDPLRERYVWRVWPSVKMDRLNAATRPLVGEHDFVAFGSAPAEEGRTVRKVWKAEWLKISEDEFIFEVSANAFLYHMVRHMVGFLVKIGQGFAEVNIVEKALREHSAKVHELAPAQGLTLVAVEY